MATSLGEYAGRGDVIVLGLARGGVVVAGEVAAALDAPLDVMVVRKLGVPRQEELAMGAVASGGVLVLNEAMVRRLGIAREAVDAAIGVERRELARRELAYRGDRPPPELDGRIVLLVDDGLATGSTMLAAVAAVRRARPAGVIVAAPVGALETCEALRGEADRVVCAITPDPFVGVGMWYEDFRQTSDDEVRGALEAAWRRRSGEGGRAELDGEAALTPLDDSDTPRGVPRGAT